MRMLRFLVLATALPALFAADARAESPQHFAFEVKFAPYAPALDQTNGLDGRTPFSDQFGDVTDPAGAAPSRGLLSLGEIDYQFFNRFGILGIGFGAGYYRRSAPAFTNVGTPTTPSFCTVKSNNAGGRTYVANGADLATPDSCFSGDENVFNIVPLSLMAVYRFDVLDKRFRIPLIPYVKVGLGYYIWWFGNSGSFVSDVNSKDASGNAITQAASGATVGVVFNPGLAIDLSALDPRSAYALDKEIGLNRVTLFAEMHGAWIQGCGCTNAIKLNLSDITVSAGLGFEF